VERGIGPDATIHLDFALHRLAGVIENLVVYPDNMLANLNRLGGLHNSQRVLLALIEAGASREDAYLYVQRNAMKVWENPNRQEGDFVDNLKSDADVSAKLSDEKIESLTDLDYHFKNVDYIFERVFA
jgi:adenylosuccinate lyase